MAVSAFSTATISERDLARIIEPLGAMRDDLGWGIERGDAVLKIQLASDSMDVLPEVFLREAATQLGGVPRSRVALFYNIIHGNAQDELLARAVCIALAERWPIVLHFHDGRCENIYPPGSK